MSTTKAPATVASETTTQVAEQSLLDQIVAQGRFNLMLKLLLFSNVVEPYEICVL